MSRKKEGQRTALNDLLWRRVDEILENSGERRSELWKRIQRNKNTYTNWTKRRTMLQISDLEELADALGVPASDLLRSQHTNEVRIQLPQSDVEAKSAQQPMTLALELEVSSHGLRIRLKE